MKKILFVAVLLVSSLTVKLADAQISFSLNIGSQPAWGPTGYDHAEFYYMPDIDTYYDVPNHQYVYLSGSRWIRSGALPPRYANYDMYHGYKAVINSPSPWRNAVTYRNKYAGYRGRHDQAVIRDSRDQRYQNHWNGDRGRGNGNGQGGNGRGNNDRGNGNDRGNNGHNDRGNKGGGDRGGDHGDHGHHE
ncbi:hypothetical protein [Mucilaginibacter polytrichastri]|uniref:Uncharacterized protein n=1 Tax=Mucilaginibacter polytrichastri TaxID=1302689 RepID=A0A1Q6A4E6_9SPHI|nr:hypothetical protein [Mucilaginibacter polytrichastri]OKS88867.1 hypothetical protein RG47T_4345 [Mucilaginibacter polytrichastri]